MFLSGLLLRRPVAKKVVMGMPALQQGLVYAAMAACGASLGLHVLRFPKAASRAYLGAFFFPSRSWRFGAIVITLLWVNLARLFAGLPSYTF